MPPGTVLVDTRAVTVGTVLMVVLYNSKNVIEVNGIKYSFGPVIVLHKGESDVECLSESEICGAVIFLMDSEVTLCYDGREFTAFELF